MAVPRRRIQRNQGGGYLAWTTNGSNSPFGVIPTQSMSRNTPRKPAIRAAYLPHALGDPLEIDGAACSSSVELPCTVSPPCCLGQWPHQGHGQQNGHLSVSRYTDPAITAEDPAWQRVSPSIPAACPSSKISQGAVLRTSEYLVAPKVDGSTIQAEGGRCRGADCRTRAESIQAAPPPKWQALPKVQNRHRPDNLDLASSRSAMIGAILLSTLASAPTIAGCRGLVRSAHQGHLEFTLTTRQSQPVERQHGHCDSMVAQPVMVSFGTSHQHRVSKSIKTGIL